MATPNDHTVLISNAGRGIFDIHQEKMARVDTRPDVLALARDTAASLENIAYISPSPKMDAYLANHQKATFGINEIIEANSAPIKGQQHDAVNEHRVEVISDAKRRPTPKRDHNPGGNTLG